jgi:hypothetical protein
MSHFLESPVSRLIHGQTGPYTHWFGGTPTHQGVVPPGREHPVHLLYDLDLNDPALGLASHFPHVSRLPLYNALQYNCCDMVYSVERDDAIRILALTNPETPQWYADHPFDNYPAAFPRKPVVAEPVSADLVEAFHQSIDDDGGANDDPECTVLTDELLFPRVGGRHFMWQGVPSWSCPTRKCRFGGTNSEAGKEVLAVIWESPEPSLHLWSDDPKWQTLGSSQIIFSRCRGCGVLHSCNRCD